MVLSYACLRYLQLKVNPYNDDSSGDDDGGEFIKKF